jgi:type IV secretion system protein TrbL
VCSTAIVTAARARRTLDRLRTRLGRGACQQFHRQDRHLYNNNATKWQSTLAAFALRLFWILAAIEFTVSFFWLAVRGADLGEWAAELLKQVLFIGFFAALLTNSAAWTKAIIDSFRQAANQAVQASGGNAGIAPSDVFDTGLQIAYKLMDQTSWYAAVTSTGLAIASLVVLITFALITAKMVITLVESYIVISAGVLLMGFGGSSWTKDFAVKTLVYAVSVGAKLFVMQLIVGMGDSLFRDLAANYGNTNADVFIVIGSAIVMLALTMSVPEMVQGLINGSSAGSGGTLSRAIVQVSGATAAAATSAAGGINAVGSAVRLAEEQQRSAESSGTPSASTARRWAQMARLTLGNLSQAASQNSGDRLSGRAPFGTRGGQMADILNRQTDELAGSRTGSRSEAGGQPEKPPAAGTIRGAKAADNAAPKKGKP